LRIHPLASPQWDAALNDLQALWSKLATTENPPLVERQPHSDSSPVEDSQLLDSQLLKTFVTTFWRFEREMATMADSEETRILKGRLRQLRNLLPRHEIQVYDYSGKTYDPDEIWDNVIADDTPKRNPIIFEMREPRIVYRGAMIQHGTPVVTDSTNTGGNQ
jgi:hypothetical protein